MEAISSTGSETHLMIFVAIWNIVSPFSPGAHLDSVGSGRRAFALDVLQSVRPLVSLLFRFRLRDSVSLLNLSDQMILLASQSLNVIVREVAPALAGRSCKLFPLAFDLIPIHIRCPFARSRATILFVP